MKVIPAGEAEAFTCPMSLNRPGGMVCMGPKCMAWIYIQPPIEILIVPIDRMPKSSDFLRMSAPDGLTQRWQRIVRQHDRLGTCGALPACAGAIDKARAEYQPERNALLAETVLRQHPEGTS